MNEEIVLEPNAKEAVDAVKNNTLVIAGPGAGKTELLAQKALNLFDNDICKIPYNILAISFKKDAAVNIKERVERRIDDGGKRFVSKTFDSFAKLLLDRFYMTLPSEIKPRLNYEIANDDKKIAAYEQVFGAEGRPQDAEEEINGLNLDELTENTNAYKMWKSLLFNFDKSYLTFRMISHLALYILQHNEYVKHIIRTAFPFVFLDEFQDTTGVQYSILKECFLHSHVNVTAVGDSKQQIMLWAGARKEIFEDYVTDFCAKKLILTENHRSAKKIVDLEKQMSDSLNESNLSEVKAQNDAEGQIVLFETNTVEEEVRLIGNDIINKINEGKNPSDIAILVKQKPEEYVEDLIEWLKDHEIIARIESAYQDSLSENLTKIILQSLLVGINRISGEQWSEYITACSNIFEIDTDDSDKLKNLVKNLKNFSDTLLQTINEYPYTDDSRNYIKRLINLIIAFFGVNRIKHTYPEYRAESFYKQTVQNLNELLATSFDSSKKNNVVEKLYNSIEIFLGKSTIPILTIHKSKGLEYDSVYFIGLEDSAFWNFKNKPESERKAFFVAISRAKNSLAFSYCKHRKTKYCTSQTIYAINEFYQLFKNSEIVETRGSLAR